MTGEPQIPVAGLICSGHLVSLGWPEPQEYDLITNLRNGENVRRWFLDERILDPVSNRAWLASGMKRPLEALLSIRLNLDHRFLGTIGWTDWDRDRGVAWFGRLAMAQAAVRKALRDTRCLQAYVGFTLDALLTIRDYAFISMKLNEIRTFFFADNKMAARINAAVGLVCERSCNRLRLDGTVTPTCEMVLTRERWRQLPRHVVAWSA